MNWIKADEQLPRDEEYVLVVTKSKNGHRQIVRGYRLGDRWVHGGTAQVTHWMPMPELPEEE